MTNVYIENLDEIKAKLNPEAVLELLQPGNKRRSGKELRSPCPVHGGDGAENFSLNVDTHNWMCHSNGCKGTNLVDLYAQSKKIQNINTAAKELAEQFDIPVSIASNRNTSYSPESILTCWDKAQPQGKDTYFPKKRLQPPPIARFGSNPKGYTSTLIALKDVNDELKCLLSLSSGGKFNFGNPKGAFALLGVINPDGEFYAGEGIATVQTAWESSQRNIPAVSCGTWSNILPVVTAIKSKYPNAKPIILIDCDGGGNGMKAAQMVAKTFPDAIFRKPDFSQFLNHNNENLSDFNDLISVCNFPLEEVERQLSIEFQIPKHEDSKEEFKQTEINSESKNKVINTCETAGEALKRMGFLDKIKSRMLELKRDGIIRLSGIPTNFIKLDEEIDGLQGGHLIILAGRTGMGKTFVAINILKNIAIDQGIPSVLFSLEMSNSQVFFRLISLLTGINSKKIKRGQISEEELAIVEEAIKRIEASPLLLSDDYSNSVLKNLSNNIDNVCKNQQAKAIFIDHIGLVSCGGAFKENRAIEMGKITMMAKLKAKEHNVPVICLAQLNREADSKESPKLSHLRESGNLEQDADIVIFIHRRDYFDPTDKSGQAEIIIAKNREGEAKNITFEYDKSTWLLKEAMKIKDQIKL